MELYEKDKQAYSSILIYQINDVLDEKDKIKYIKRISERQ